MFVETVFESDGKRGCSCNLYVEVLALVSSDPISKEWQIKPVFLFISHKLSGKGLPLSRGR